MSDSIRRGDEVAPVSDAGLFDYALLRDWVGFAWRAPGRHRLLAAVSLVGVLGATGLFAWGYPQRWEVRTEVLAQRNQVMGTLSNPAIVRPEELDAPTRAARETVLCWDNRVALVQKTGLVDLYLAQRAPFVRWRDALVETLTGKVRTREQLTDDLAKALAKRISVDVNGGVVTIAVRWSEPTTALRLADAATQSFLEVRHASEISVIEDAVAVLESHAAEVQGEIDKSLNQVIALEKALAPPGAAVLVRRSPDAPGGEPGQEAELARLQQQLVAKQRAVSDLEEFRRRRLSELQEQLAAKQAVYSPKHPDVMALRQTLATLELPSEQVESLRRDSEALEARILKLDRRPGASARGAAEPEFALDRRAGLVGEDPRLATERGRLRALYDKYWNLRDRMDGARLERDTARAAFKYRYSVALPAQLPKAALWPNWPLLVAGGLLGAVLFCFFACFAVDLRSGVIVEPWQLRRQLGLEVLGERAR